MGVFIRRACNGDIPRIAELLYEVNEVHHRGRPDLFRHGQRKYTDDELSSILSDEKAPVFVADDGEVVLGYSFCVIEEHGGNMTDIKTLYIDDICVDENARRRGVGTALFRHVTEFARAEECYNVTLNVWRCNPGAEAFYRSLGMGPMKTCLEKIV